MEIPPSDLRQHIINIVMRILLNVSVHEKIYIFKMLLILMCNVLFHKFVIEDVF